MYTIKQDESGWTVLKNDKPLVIPFKFQKYKKLSFKTQKDAQAYIDNVYHLIKNGEEYQEITQTHNRYA